jgi:hypothetical protein
MAYHKTIGHKLRLFENSQVEYLKSIGFAFALDQAKEFGVISEIGNRVTRAGY